LHIGIDLMGGDTPPDELFDGILSAAAQLSPSTNLVVLASTSVVERLSQQSLPHSIRLIATGAAIAMEDAPLLAVRTKGDSSMMVGIRQLADQKLDALISAGNTGALIAGAALLMAMLPTVQRPALLASVPTRKGFVALIDAGGHVHWRPEQLVTFAHLGTAFQQCYRSTAFPRVGLLNVGVEGGKGSTAHLQAYAALSAAAAAGSINFTGNVEALAIFDGDVDVLVTDGFTGNILLKTCEGAVSFVLGVICDSIPDAAAADLAKSLRSTLDSRHLPGALVCGVDGLIMKCHGNSTATSLHAAILEASALLEADLIGKLKASLSILKE
jgi:glycerol-3-phosphate acyltransferase PlsX